MYKVGQRVKVTNIESNPWYNFRPEDKEKYLNKIFKVIDDIGISDRGHAYVLDTPHGRPIFLDSQFRALRKKKDTAPAKVKVVSLKEEVTWLNKVQENFQNAGKVQTIYDDMLNAPNRHANIFGTTRARPLTVNEPVEVPARYTEMQAPRITLDEAQDMDADELEGILGGDYEPDEPNEGR